MPHSETIINGEHWPSVTECVGILDKPFLPRWRGKVGNAEADRISRESAEIGTEVHKLIEVFLKENQVATCGLSSIVSRCFGAWFDWWHKEVYEPVSLEKKVFSYKHKYAGTFDAVLYLNGELYITDWKVSNNDDKHRYLQLAGYAKAYAEQAGCKIKKGLIVRINKEGKVKVTEIKNLWKYVPFFLACRKLHNFVKGTK